LGTAHGRDKMDLVSYSLAAIIVVLGFVCGIVLRLFTKEEMKAGRKYFIYLQYAILAVIIALMIYFRMHYVIILIFLAVLVMVFSKSRMKKPMPASVYIIFGMLFFEASRSSLFILFSSLMFLFGFPAGSLMDLKKKWQNHDIAYIVSFLVMAFVLYFVIP
jgi:hypothetical protein